MKWLNCRCTQTGWVAFDGDPGLCEEGVGTLPERDGGLLLLVGEDLAVGEAGVVVDGVAEVAVAGAGADLAARLTPEGFVAAAVGDVAQFLDVDVDEFARLFALPTRPASSGWTWAS